MTSHIVWRGLSQLDGVTPVCVVLTDGSANRKTGGMCQAYILVDRANPHTAWTQGRDSAVCGDCPLRGRKGETKRRCYVSFATGLSSIGKRLEAGLIPEIPMWRAHEMLVGRSLRLGAYGDPAAVPLYLWETLTNACRTWTGYTHQWRNPAHAGLARLCMASCDSEADRVLARSMGWRTFRVRRDGPIGDREIMCPASDEAGKRTTCERCGLCAGTSRAAKDVTILDHGPGARTRGKRTLPLLGATP